MYVPIIQNLQESEKVLHTHILYTHILYTHTSLKLTVAGTTVQPYSKTRIRADCAISGIFFAIKKGRGGFCEGAGL